MPFICPCLAVWFQSIWILMWLGVPSYLIFAMAWSSELFEFCHGFGFRAIWFLPWLGVPSYLNFTMAWRSELFDFSHCLEFLAIWSSFCCRTDKEKKRRRGKSSLEAWIENVCHFNATHVRFCTGGGCTHAVDSATRSCSESYIAYTSQPGSYLPPLDKWMLVVG